MSTHHVEVVRAEQAPTLVVAAETTWQEFPSLWRPLLDQVWARLRAAGITSGCPNVMLYLDDVPHVEVGVLSDRASVAGDGVVASQLPAGRVATVTHTGSYDGIGRAHDAVGRWIAASSERAAGPRWEVYGPHDDDPAKVWVQVSYLLVDDGSATGGAHDGRGIRQNG
jgi:effector-binding domain-containing protein